MVNYFSGWLLESADVTRIHKFYSFFFVEMRTLKNTLENLNY